MESTLLDLNVYVLAILLFGLIVLSSFFSGSETALLGFDWLRLRYLARKGNRRAKLLEKILRRKERLIGTILVGNNVANVAASAIATAVAISLWGERGIVVSTAVMTLVLLIFSEIAPKTLASRRVETVGLAVAPIYVVLTVLFMPVVVLVTAVSNVLLRLVGVRPEAHISKSLSEEEIHSLLSDTSSTADVAENKRKMLHGIFQMSQKLVRQIMTPRTRIRALEITALVSEATEEFVRTGHTRLPVYRETLDNVAGFIHARDVIELMRDEKMEKGLVSVMRDTHFVPETMNLETLLYEFQRRHTHMAIVVDEFGGVEGLVTLEDVLEEIVGDIHDEHDMEGQTIRFLPGGEALVQGLTPIGEVNSALKLNIPTKVDVTIAGFIMTRLSHIPERGESVLYQDVRFTVERTSKHRVLLVRVTPAPQ
jgi:putative hemolysin